ncbi:MAG: HYR domain-containing protein, partial [Saprospiraceae bacterium]|nr:HYR domain-containing protein [Saprospiraceae bacterium]
AGATSAVVTWQAPQATSSCDQGSTNCQPENIPGFNVMGEMNGKVYYISTVEKNWTDAKAHCEAQGGQLAIVDSPAKNSFLAGGIGFFSAAYIGLTDKDSEGNYQWLNGAPFAYQNWEPGQPNGGTDENYVAMHGWSSGRWADYNFWTAKKYILEKSCTGSSGLNISQTGGPASGSTFPIGNTTVTYSATDACGGTATCSFTVTVEAPGGGGSCDENLSLNKLTAQSSNRFNAVASRAVDGNTSGNFWLDFSVSHTEWEDFPWWEVDLVKNKFIDHINLWNRTDCCAEHLAGVYVLVSETPFVSYDLDDVLAQPGVSAYFIENQVGLPTSLSVKHPGRYVRVQMNKQTFLALAEVEVFGCENGSDFTTPNTSLFFDANLKGGKEVALRWVEIPVAGKSYYTLEKSTDGQHFEPLIAQVNVNLVGTSPVYLNYDFQPKDGENYYRLKSVYLDGRVEYSPVRKIAFNLEENFTVFPNPSNDRVWVNLERFAGKDVTVLISNPYGQLLFEQSLNNLQETMLEIDLRQAGIRDGVYFVSVIHKGRAFTKRLMVTSSD